jgi:magnesium chelatase subunit H
VRTLSEQVALETRTRMLNPKWYEGMLNTATKACARSRCTSPTPWAGRPPPARSQPWVYQQLTETFMLDEAMRERLAKLNPAASAKVANRLIEAHERHYWNPDDRRSKRCAVPARNSKTASKASSTKEMAA